MKTPKLPIPIHRAATGQDFSFRFNEFNNTYTFAVMLKTSTGDANVYCDVTEEQAKALVALIDSEVKRDKNDELI